MFAKPKVELIFTIAAMKNRVHVEYLKNDNRYDVGLKGGHIKVYHGLSIGNMNFDLG